MENLENSWSDRHFNLQKSAMWPPKSNNNNYDNRKKWYNNGTNNKHKFLSMCFNVHDIFNSTQRIHFYFSCFFFQIGKKLFLFCKNWNSLFQFQLNKIIPSIHNPKKARKISPKDLNWGKFLFHLKSGKIPQLNNEWTNFYFYFILW